MNLVNGGPAQGAPGVWWQVNIGPGVSFTISAPSGITVIVGVWHRDEGHERELVSVSRRLESKIKYSKFIINLSSRIYLSQPQTSYRFCDSHGVGDSGSVVTTEGIVDNVRNDTTWPNLPNLINIFLWKYSNLRLTGLPRGLQRNDPLDFGLGKNVHGFGDLLFDLSWHIPLPMLFGQGLVQDQNRPDWVGFPI